MINLQSLGLSSGMAQKLNDYAGGGGIGGTAAKSLFYPGQQTGFAGVGSGIKGGKNTIDELLKSANTMAGGR